jgi:hypothetical protein
VARRRLSIELDENLIEVVRAVADRSTVTETELYERALRDVLVRDFAELMVEIDEYQTASGTKIDADDGQQLAVDEVRATRVERRHEP